MQYFSEETKQSAKVEMRAGCLVGFDMDNYPDPFDPSGQSIAAAVNAAIQKWEKRICDKIANHGLDNFTIDVFCVPMPSVDAFRSALRTSLKL